MKVTYVISLERSGSTFLDLALSSKFNLVGCGEIFRTIYPHGVPDKPFLELTCSCGKRASTCKVWGNILKEAAETPFKTQEIAYTKFFENLGKTYQHDDITIIDSSKSLAALRALKNINCDISVIFMIRDIRGWTQSIWDAEKRKTEIPILRIMKPNFKAVWKAYVRHQILRRIPLWIYLEWYIRNRKIKLFLKQSSLNYLQISYENLALDYTNTMSQISSFLDSPECKQDEKNNSHILRGNRTARSKEKFVIKYSDKWKKNFFHKINMLLLFPLYFINKKWTQ